MMHETKLGSNEEAGLSAMAQEILALVTSLGGGVSFVELGQITGFGGGELELTLNNKHASNIVLWSGLTEQAVDALEELRASGLMHARPTSPLVYWIDGAALSLPLAKKPRHYKTPHWGPATFYPGPAAGVKEGRR